MAKKDKAGFDDIFASTAPQGKEPKKGKAEKQAVAAPVPPAPPTERLAKTGALQIDPAALLLGAWANHEAEALYRKGKEDRILCLTLALLVALLFGSAWLLLSAKLAGWSWFARFVFRIVAALGVFAFAFAGNALIELNRKRLQDVLAMIVKIQDSLRLFEENAIPGADGSFYPNTYKFIGSSNDDETNYAQMILKIGGAAAIVVMLILL